MSQTSPVPVPRRQFLFGAAAAGAVAALGDFLPRVGPLARLAGSSVASAQGSALWELGGDYVESCSCDFLCPCSGTSGFVPPTKGSCAGIQGYHIGLGRHGSTRLDGLNFALIFWYPGRPAEGNGTLGVIIDERANPDQREALTAIASGQAGGPATRAVALTDTFLGAEFRPVTIERDGMRWSISIPGLANNTIEGVPGRNREEPVWLDNTGRGKLGLARSSRSQVNAFGIQWDDDGGRNNGFFGPFSWQGS